MPIITRKEFNIMPNKKKQTAVSLDQDVLEYLKKLSVEEERSRSQLM